MISLKTIGVFEDEDITHVEGAIDPVRDMEIISEELRKKVSLLACLNSGVTNQVYLFSNILKDIETMEKHFER